MGTHMGHVFTLANSIIGVSVLAMPFCFRQCGILLSVLMLLLSSYISRLACHYLMKSAITERMKNFEMLAFRTFGPTGKLVVELSIIGFMLGTCVAFFVVIGDLGPNIIGPIVGLEHPTALRPSVLIGTAVFVVLPLGLLRNVDSLNGICAVSLAFYGVLVLKVFLESSSNLFDPHVWKQIYYWRPSGLLRCVPIFSMALSCQTQLFEVFGSLPTTPLERANGVVKSAVNLTTFFYIAVGSLGYLAYANKHLTGNVMMNFSEGASSEVIKICFLFSVAVSFPLVIFPCRASIYSFLYNKIQHSYEGMSSAHIPETRFQCITLVIVTSSLVIGLMIPNIELVLGLVGSTLGVFICVITPGLIFTTITLKKNNERLLAKILVGTGMVVMVLGTYANLYATEETFTAPPEPLVAVELHQPELLPPLPNLKKDVAKMEKVLKQLEKEEEQRKEENSLKRKDPPVKSPSQNVVADAKVSPASFSDQNPQPQKVNEGPKPQPVAPEPPDELIKTIPINIPESLPNLGEQKEPVAKKVDSPLLLEGTPEVIRKAVSSSGVMEKIAKTQEAKSVDPVQPVAPVEVPASPILDKEPKSRAQPDTVPKKPGKEHEKSLLVEKRPENKSEAVKPHETDGKEVMMSKMENEVVKEPLQMAQQVEEKPKPPNNNLSMSMAQGVPLPLAIKGLEDKKKISSDQQAKVGRDILFKTPEEPELREKRDLEATEKGEAANVVENVVNDQSKAVKMDFQSKSEELATSKVNATEVKSGQIENDYILPEKPKHSDFLVDSHSEQVEEECPKTTAKIEQDSPVEPNLIKSPSKLTNENVVLPGGNGDLLGLKDRPDLLDIKNLGKQKK